MDEILVRRLADLKEYMKNSAISKRSAEGKSKMSEEDLVTLKKQIMKEVFEGRPEIRNVPALQRTEVCLSMNILAGNSHQVPRIEAL